MSLILTGAIAGSSMPGKLGFRWDVVSHVIMKVHNPSPAFSAGLKVGDKVVGWEEDGPASKIVYLTIRRKGWVDYTVIVEKAPY